MEIRKKLAFTIAEMLIVIGIIGVVAELTLPAFIDSQQKIQYTIRLKKTYTELTQMFNKYLADQNVESLRQTDLYTASRGINYTEYNDFIGRYFKNIKEYPYGTESPFDNILYRYLYNKPGGETTFSPNTYRFYNASGVFIMVAVSPGLVYIDVNGEKKPNVIGRDFFGFGLTSKGKLVPVGSQEFADMYWSGVGYWRNYPTLECGSFQNPVLSGSPRGWGCAARIMEESWQMNY